MTKPRGGVFGRAALKVLRIAVLVYFGLAVVLAVGQRRYIYYPERESAERLRLMAQASGLEPWLAENGEAIGWRTTPVPAGQGSGRVVLVFHGNAGYAIHRAYFVDALMGLPNRSVEAVYLFEYPGYGARPGEPSEKTIKQAASAALEMLTRAGDARVYLLGESLGGGVASYLAGAYPDRVAGVFLATPFSSLVEVAKHHYPILPVSLFMRERYDNVAALKTYHGPLAVLVAAHDEVVPAELGKRLYESYAGPKRLFEDDASHNTLLYDARAEWWLGAWDFLFTAGPAKP